MIMFAQSAVVQQNYRPKNGTQTRFLVAKPACAFHFFVFLTIGAFLFWTVAPAAMAQENATSTQEIFDGQSLELPVINLQLPDGDNATSTEESQNEETQNTEALNSETPDNETQNEETENNESQNIEIPNVEDANATSSEETANDELLIISDDANATSTEDAQNDESPNIQPIVEIEFTNVYYGQVSENQETVARITEATIRNISGAPAAIMLWQDDMGLGQGFGNVWNIQYGARVESGEWTVYDPLEMIILPDVLMPGQSAQMEFSVKVLNFPEIESGAEINYQGIMTINGIAAPQAEASLPLLNDVLSDDSDFKAEADGMAIPVE